MTPIPCMLCYMVVSVTDSVAIDLEVNSLTIDVLNLVNFTENTILFSVYFVIQLNLLPKTRDCNFVQKM